MVYVFKKKELIEIKYITSNFGLWISFSISLNVNWGFVKKLYFISGLF